MRFLLRISFITSFWQLLSMGAFAQVGTVELFKQQMFDQNTIGPVQSTAFNLLTTTAAGANISNPVSVKAEFVNQQFTGILLDNDIDNPNDDVPTPAITTALNGLEFGVNNPLNDQKRWLQQFVGVLISDVGNPLGSYFTSPRPSTGGLTLLSNGGFSMQTIAEGIPRTTMTADGQRIYFGDLVYTFSRPVDFPILHVVGIGGYIGTTDDQYFGKNVWHTEYDAQGGISMTKLSGTNFLDISNAGTTIRSTFTFDDHILPPNNGATGASGAFAGTGSILINSTNVTSVTFRVYAVPTNPDQFWNYPETIFSPVINSDKVTHGWSIETFPLTGQVVIDNTAAPGDDVAADAGTTFNNYTTATGGSIYALLLDETGKLISYATVDPSTGAYSFGNVAADTYRVVLSTTQPTPAQLNTTSYTVGPLASGWVHSGQTFNNANAVVNDGNWIDNTTVITPVNYGTYTAAAGGSFKLIQGIGTSSTILPVKMGKMFATATGCAANLKWSSLTETNFSNYQVQRSVNGRDFTTVSTIKATGSGSNYAYLDANAKTGTNYYRLLLVDADGKSSYSEIVSVKMNCGAGGIRVYPTVTTSTVKVTGLQAGDELVVIDNLGRRMQTRASNNQPETVNLQGYAAGVYTILVMRNNTIEARQKVVKQ